MKYAKPIAYGLWGSIGLAFLAEIVELSDDVYALAGLGMIGFGIAAGIVLYRNHEEA